MDESRTYATTEAEWLACCDYLQLFRVLRSQTTGLRKWRLAALACLQLLPVEFQGAEIPVALSLVSDIVEGTATFEEAESLLRSIAPEGLSYNWEGKLIQSWRVGACWDVVGWVRPTHADPLAVCQKGVMESVGTVATSISNPDQMKRDHLMLSGRLSALQAAHRIASAQACHVLKDIFGNPFRPVVFQPEWRTDTAVAVARQMYESREFGAMPILADALQDAGCEDDNVLAHCRGPGPHVRGCWVVDLVLDKE